MMCDFSRVTEAVVVHASVRSFLCDPRHREEVGCFICDAATNESQLRRRVLFVMKFHRFAVSLILAFTAVMLCVGVALAGTPYLEAGHVSRASMGTDFKPDYGTAAFSFAWLEIYEAAAGQTGTITLNGGGYEYRAGGDPVSVPGGTDKTFNLSDGGDYYAPADDAGNEISFVGTTDTAISGMGFSFTIGGNTVSGTTPTIRSTANQLYAPYVALTVDGNGMATGLTWYLVNPQNPTAPLVRDTGSGIDPARVGRIRVRLLNGNDHYSENQNVSFTGTETLSTPRTITFDPIPVNQIRLVRVNVESAATGTNSTCFYAWEFIPPANPFVRVVHSANSYFENGKTNHLYGDNTPKLAHLYAEVSGIPNSSGQDNLAITLKNNVHVFYEDSETGETTAEEDVAAGLKTFPLQNFYGYYSLSNGNGAEAYFTGGGETGLSESNFTVTVGSEPFTGTTGKIRSVTDQIANGCVPYIEFDPTEVASGRITKATLRFVDSLNATTAVTRDADKRNIGQISNLQLRMKNGGRYTLDPDKSSVEVGQPLTFTFAFGEGGHAALYELSQVRVYFGYNDPSGTNSGTTYAWRLTVMGTEKTLNPTKINQPKPAELNSVAQALGLSAEKVVSVNSALVSTQYDQFNALKDVEGIGMENFNFARTMSAFFVSQDVTAGGAVVLGTGTNLPFSDKGFDTSTALNIPTAFDLDNMRTHYSVIKSFPNGGTIDLLATYGSDLFTFSSEGVTLKATVAIVDGKAPTNDSR